MHGVAPERIATIYNWVDAEWIKPTPPLSRERTRFLYAGNLGYSQGFDTLIEAAAGLDGIELDIVGDGNAARDVTQRAEEYAHVRVRPPVPRHAFPDLLASADVHVVVQREVSAGANLPSKIASYLASGRPVVASIGLHTAAAELLRASGGAVLVPPESPRELARAMHELHGDPERRAELGRKARRYAVEHLAKAPALERLERELVA